MALLMYTYVVSDIFTVIKIIYLNLKISNYSLHSSLPPTEGQAQPRRYAAAIYADFEAHCPRYRIM